MTQELENIANVLADTLLIDCKLFASMWRFSETARRFRGTAGRPPEAGEQMLVILQDLYGLIAANMRQELTEERLRRFDVSLLAMDARLQQADQAPLLTLVN